jgi:hypothetical protein
VDDIGAEIAILAAVVDHVPGTRAQIEVVEGAAVREGHVGLAVDTRSQAEAVTGTALVDAHAKPAALLVAEVAILRPEPSDPEIATLEPGWAVNDPAIEVPLPGEEGAEIDNRVGAGLHVATVPDPDYLARRPCTPMSAPRRPS